MQIIRITTYFYLFGEFYFLDRETIVTINTLKCFIVR